MKKKIYSILLSVIMIITTCIPSLATTYAPSTSFSDLPAGSYYTTTGGQGAPQSSSIAHKYGSDWQVGVCILPGATLNGNSPDSSIGTLSGSIIGSYLSPSSYGNWLTADEIATFIKYICGTDYSSNDYTWAAVQTLVWEVIVGERNSSFDKINSPAVQANGLNGAQWNGKAINIRTRTIDAQSSYDKSQIESKYNEIVNEVKKAMKSANFSSSSQTLSGSGSTVTFTDNNYAISDYGVGTGYNSNNIEVTKSGNKVTVKSKTNAAFEETITFTMTYKTSSGSVKRQNGSPSSGQYSVYQPVYLPNPTTDTKTVTLTVRQAAADKFGYLSLEKLVNGSKSSKGSGAVINLYVDSSMNTYLGKYTINNSGDAILTLNSSAYATADGNLIKFDLNKTSGTTFGSNGNKIWWKEVTMPSDKSVIWGAAQSGNVTITESSKTNPIKISVKNTYTVPQADVYAYLVLTKTVDSGSPKGAEFKVGTTSTNWVAKFKMESSTSGGKAKITELDSSTSTWLSKHDDYTLKINLTKAPSSFTSGGNKFYWSETVLPASGEWTGKDSGDITVSSSNTSSNPATIRANNYKKPEQGAKESYVILEKLVNGSKSSLAAGAEIKIYVDSSYTNRIATYTIDSSGTAILSNVSGSYVSQVGNTLKFDLTKTTGTTFGNNGHKLWWKETIMPSTTSGTWGSAQSGSVTVTERSSSNPIKISVNNTYTPPDNPPDPPTPPDPPIPPTPSETIISISFSKRISGYVNGEYTWRGVKDCVYELYDHKGTKICEFVIDDYGEGVPRNLHYAWSQGETYLGEYYIYRTVDDDYFYIYENFTWEETYRPEAPSGYIWADSLYSHSGTTQIRPVDSADDPQNILDYNSVEQVKDKRSIEVRLTKEITGDTTNVSYAKDCVYELWLDNVLKLGEFKINEEGVGIPQNVMLGYTIDGDAIKWQWYTDVTNKVLSWKEVSRPSAPTNYEWTDTNLITHTGSTTIMAGTDTIKINFEDSNELRATVNSGYLTVDKNVFPNNSEYKPTGAVYSVFDTRAKAQEALTSHSSEGALLTFTINVDGKSNTQSVDLGTDDSKDLYIVETKLPSTTYDNFSWNWDTNIYETTVTSSSTTTNPVKVVGENTYTLSYFGNITVNKSITPINNEYKPTGAIYSVFDTEDKANNARDNHSSTGALLNFTIDEDGTSIVQQIELGTDDSKDLWIVETKLPTTTYDGFTWYWDTEVKKVTVNNTHTSTSPLIVNVTNTYDLSFDGYLTVNKIITPANNDYKPTGAIYSAFETRDAAQAAITSHSSADAVLTFTIDVDGKSNVQKVSLGSNTNKTLYIVETSLPTTTYDGFTWNWDTEIHIANITNTSTDTTPIQVTGVNGYGIVGYIQLVKEVVGKVSPIGAEYTVYDGNNVVGKFTVTDEKSGNYYISTVSDASGVLKIKDSNTFEVVLDSTGSKTLTIKETKLPYSGSNATWTDNTTPLSITVTSSSTYTNPYKVIAKNTVTEVGELVLYKIVTGDVSPEGAEYSIYLTENDARLGQNAIGKFIVTNTKSGDKYISTVANVSDILSKKDDNTIIVDLSTNGSVDLYIKETKLPTTENSTWIDNTTSINPKKVTVTSTALAEVICENIVNNYGWLKIKKEVSHGYEYLVDKSIIDKRPEESYMQ